MGVPLHCEQCLRQTALTRMHTAHRAVAHGRFLNISQAADDGCTDVGLVTVEGAGIERGKLPTPDVRLAPGIDSTASATSVF